MPGLVSSMSNRIKHRLKWAMLLLLSVLLVFALAWIFTPWPKALLIRYFFNYQMEQVIARQSRYVPVGVTALKNLQYRQGDEDAWLDIYYPPAAIQQGRALPVIVWTHGGAWISGKRAHVADYLKILASHGYAAVTIDYSVAPEKHYPTPLVQLNAALAYLQTNAQHLHLDTQRMVLAGDSAGAQITAQVATIISNPAYARQMNIQPAIQPGQLKGLILNCGVYDTSLVNYDGVFGGFLKTVMWSYSGNRDFLNDARLDTLSVVNYVNAQFPPAFITVGNDDPLKSQSFVMAARLQQLGVPTDTLFYPEQHPVDLPHEYQFNLDDRDAQVALQRMLGFLQQQLKANENMLNN